MASRYDDELWELVDEDAGPPPGHQVDFVRSLPADGRVLDLGCGDGRLSTELAADRVTVADVSAVALERAARRMPRARALELDPDAVLPVPDGSFELVLCAETIEHVRDVQLLLSECRRVLVPGGRLAVTTPSYGRRAGLGVLVDGFESRFDPLSPHLRFLTRRSLTVLLEAMGFELEWLRVRGGTLLVRATR